MSMAGKAAAAAAALTSCTVFADTPAFDRPGIAFSTTTLPRGAVSWEQGLPDFVHDDEGGARSTTYSATTNLRIGLAERVEIQLSASPLNYARQRDGSSRSSARGAGDSGVALKIALPVQSAPFSWALYAGTTFDTGARDFTNGATAYNVATTLGYDWSDTVSSSLYLGVERSDGVDTWTWSPSVGFAIDERLGAYVEAGFEKPEHGPSTCVAGGGLTWMVTPTLQLDVSATFGLDEAAPDVQGGFGLSVYFE